MKYSDRNVKLYRRVFSPDKIAEKSVSLWNICPPSWPGRTKSKITDDYLTSLMKLTHDRSIDSAHLILWMPSSKLHQTIFDPLTMCGRWYPRATIFSGSDPLAIGYVYSKTCTSWINWSTKLILDERGKCGPNSTKTVKFILDEFDDLNGSVVDPFAHKSAVLPSWTRRAGLNYIGFVKSKKSYLSIVSELSQVEIPGIQLEIHV